MDELDNKTANHYKEIIWRFCNGNIQIMTALYKGINETPLPFQIDYFSAIRFYTNSWELRCQKDENFLELLEKRKLSKIIEFPLRKNVYFSEDETKKEIVQTYEEVKNEFNKNKRPLLNMMPLEFQMESKEELQLKINQFLINDKENDYKKSKEFLEQLKEPTKIYLSSDETESHSKVLGSNNKYELFQNISNIVIDHLRQSIN
ncbi:hypothetical protein HOK68_03395 [Candidatus Woesearchaeota archaeon]|jgi:hypothetical protein|nr:hypothetical protein [Candidatus Woesearchaeota archaeon]MBT4387592.1 hypothetical protein [Candidatus Woesearchaeota archaeon]MBT4596046.1 hypothetical protein [Candidatus Woesearchaeota archaeon]MBT5740754.1 hypothetical protein [Candidatus Woesearchaeota archaeon]MBT6505798.1 hypothetical protein [Candidatus Woesearchaeota archaeon]